MKGSLRSLANFSAKLRALPTSVAIRVTERAAPELTALARQTFSQGTNPYGVPWLPNSEGERVTLRRSGGIEKSVFYVAIGTKLRIRMGVSYAKYQIGKRPVFPSQGSALPGNYSATLARVTVDVVNEAFAQARGGL